MDGFGDRLRRLRRERNVTQSQLAAEIGVVASAVGKYEHLPQSYPSVEVLVKIADYFHVSTDYLLKGAQTLPSIEKSIRDEMLNNDNKPCFSPEAVELLRIYETLKGRDRLKLLHYAMKLEEDVAES